MKLEPQVKWLDIVTRTMDVFIAESRCDRHPFSLILPTITMWNERRCTQCFILPDSQIRNNELCPFYTTLKTRLDGFFSLESNLCQFNPI